MKVFHSNENQSITFLDERFYQSSKTEKWYPSNTTILDVYPKGYGYIQWLKDLGSNADKVIKDAGDQGTHIHDAAEAFYNGDELIWKDEGKEEPNYTMDEWLMILKIVEFHKAYQPEVIAIEQVLVSDELEFGTRIDMVCRLPITGKDVWCIDWKSGGGIYKSNEIQVAACKEIWNSMDLKDDKGNIIKINRVGLMHLRAATKGPDKTGKSIQGLGWKLNEVEDTGRMWKLFQHAQDIWKEENPNPMPKNMVYPDRVSMKLIAEQPKGGESK